MTVDRYEMKKATISFFYETVVPDVEFGSRFG